MKKIIFIIVAIFSPVLAFAQTAPMNDTGPTASVAGLVFQEIVALPLYILQKYQTPLVGMAIIIAIFSAILGILKWMDLL